MFSRIASCVVLGMIVLALVPSAQAQVNSADLSPASAKLEHNYWTMIRARHSRKLFEQYLMRFPQGEHVSEALSAIKSLPSSRDNRTMPDDDEFDFSTSGTLAGVSQQGRTGRKQPTQNQPQTGETPHQQTARSKPSLADPAINEPLPPEDCGGQAECKKPPQPVRDDPQPSDSPQAKPTPSVDVPIIAKPTKSGTEQNALDLAFWTSIKESDNPVLYKGYLDKFPNGVFAVIAREKLKTLAGKTADNPTPPAKQVPASPAKQSPNKLTLTLNGLGNLTGQTPFTLAAIKKALPGYEIMKTVTHGEGMTEISYQARKSGKLMLDMIGDAGKIFTLVVRDRSIFGPNGVRVGDGLAKIRRKIPLGDCIGGYDEMADHVECSPLKDDDVFSFSFALKNPLPPIPDNQAVTASMLPQTLRLTTIIWRPRDPATKTQRTSSQTSQSSLPAVEQSAQQLLQQANAIMDKAYQMDVSKWQGAAQKAVKIYRQAAEKGSGLAWFKIGALHENGTLGSKDNNTAIAYYEKAVAAGYLSAYSRIMLVQGQFRNFKGAANTFFRFYRANPDQALKEYKDNGFSLDTGRAIQSRLKKAGYYRGPVDGQIGPTTRRALATYVKGGVPHFPATTTQANKSNMSALAKKLQRQLRRVNCYNGAVDGKWGAGSSRALRNFNRWAGHNLPVARPTPQALRAVTRERGAICGVD